MKKMIYAHNFEKGTKQFTKYVKTPTGSLVIDFFMPEAGFSYVPIREKYVRFISAHRTIDGRKTIVTYEVHPSHLIGEDFMHPKFIRDFEVINEIYSKYIRLI